MSQQNSQDPCAPAGSGLMSVADARTRIASLVRTIQGIEMLPLRSALDRVLAQDIVSTLDVPPYDNSAMDGYAVRAEDLSADHEVELRLLGKSFAGAPYSGEFAAGGCVRIMTGAVMPSGADTVIMQEHVQATDKTILVKGQHRVGENVRYAGEDMRRGDVILNAGRRLTPADLGVIASLGIGELQVRRCLRVAFFSTGDELCGVGQPLGEGQIYDSNRYTLHGMLRRTGVEAIDLGVIRDDRDAVRTAFRDAAAIADVVITSGGVSVGEADFVKEILEETGRVDFWRIAMKPGKPLAFGTIGDAVFFGLPGNPVSVMATFYQFVRPALMGMAGEAVTEPLTLRLATETPLKKSPGRTEFQRGRLVYTPEGELRVTTTGMQGSHVLTSMSQADCFIILPAESAGAAAGDSVEVQPFAGLI